MRPREQRIRKFVIFVNKKSQDESDIHAFAGAI